MPAPRSAFPALAATLALLAVEVAVGCSGRTTAAGGLELIVTTDLKTPDVFDTLRVEIAQETTPGTFHTWVASDYHIPSETTLPTTVSIAAGSGPDQDALIRLTARKGPTPVVLREVQLQVPKDRVAELKLVISSMCYGKLIVDAQGSAQTACSDPTQSCQPETGGCGPTLVSTSLLPTYSPTDLPTGDSGGTIVVTPADSGGDVGADASAVVSNEGQADVVDDDVPDTFVAPSTSDASDASPVDATLAPDAAADAPAVDSAVSSGIYQIFDAGDLAPPSAEAGVSISTPAVTVAPGQELFDCYYATLTNASAIEVGALQLWMSQASYRLEVYENTGTLQPDGTLSSCSATSGTLLFATWTTEAVAQLTLPPSVGFPLPAGTQLILYLHAINPNSTTAQSTAKANLLYATNVAYQAAAMVAFNTQINVPPASDAGPGMQTVHGTCAAPAGSQFFLMTTFTNRHATSAVVDFVHSSQNQEILRTGSSPFPLDQLPGTGGAWDNPGVATWSPATYLTVGSGDSFAYSCSYTNTSSVTLTVGSAAIFNEQCRVTGLYFPAGSATCN